MENRKVIISLAVIIIILATILIFLDLKRNADSFRKIPELYNWSDDNITLMRSTETGEYGCFGCGETMCIDPAPIMQTVNETAEKYCNANFEIIERWG